MKKLYFLNEEESNRILNLHKKAVKKQFLNEAGPYQDTESIPSSPTTPASPTTPTTPSTPTTPTTPTTPSTPASPTTSTPTTPTGSLTQQLQTLIGAKADDKFGKLSLQALTDKLKTVPKPSTPTPATGTPATGTPATGTKMNNTDL